MNTRITVGTAAIGAFLFAALYFVTARHVIADQPQPRTDTAAAPARAAGAGGSPDPGVALDGVWHNQLHSQMELKYDRQTHTLTGTYENHAKPAAPPYPKYDLVGTVNGDIVSFTVNWRYPKPEQQKDQYGSIASWVGQVYKNPETDKEEIRTVWVIARPQKPDQVWNGVTTGSDLFQRGPTPPVE